MIGHAIDKAKLKLFIFQQLAQHISAPGWVGPVWAVGVGMKSDAIVPVGRRIMQAVAPIGIVENPTPAPPLSRRTPVLYVSASITIIKIDLGNLVLHEVIDFH